MEHAPQVDHRIDALDVLRGVGILGILVVHMPSFASISGPEFNPTVFGDLSGANWWIWLATYLVADGKFIAIFAMLFGAGIVVLARGRERAGLPAASLHYRRMLGLAIIGLLHAYLLWYGDMLVKFALCGACVFAYHRASPARLLVLGGGVFCVGSIALLLAAVSFPSWSPAARAALESTWSPSAVTIAEEIAAYRGGWLDQMSHRIPAAFAAHTSGMARVFWQTSGLMLIGMGLFKLGVFSASRSTAWYRGLALGGVVTGLPLLLYAVHRNFAHGWELRDVMLVGAQFSYFGHLCVGLAWIGGVMLLRRSGWSLAPVAAVGRTALTNYLLQTVICTTIFYGHGFGMFARVDRLGQLAIVVGIWTVELVASSLWMRHFTMGPVEWLWRSATYGRRLPLLKRQAVTV